jgi:hypothetical protein
VVFGRTGVSQLPSVPDELAMIVQQILADGSFARDVERMGREDPDIATL